MPRSRCAAVLHRRQACHDLPSCVQGSVREIAAMKGAQGCSGHRTGTCAYRAAGQLVSDRAVPARQGDQIAAAINEHQPGGPGKTAPDKTFRNGRERPRVEHTSPFRPRNATRTAQDGDSQLSPACHPVKARSADLSSPARFAAPGTLTAATVANTPASVAGGTLVLQGPTSGPKSATPAAALPLDQSGAEDSHSVDDAGQPRRGQSWA